MAKCGKIRHPSRVSACIARDKINKKRGRLLSVYQCGDCKGWHLGNNSGTRLENINRVFDRLPISDRCDEVRRMLNATD